jgi:hypothetical protein
MFSSGYKKGVYGKQIFPVRVLRTGEVPTFPRCLLLKRQGFPYGWRRLLDRLGGIPETLPKIPPKRLLTVDFRLISGFAGMRPGVLTIAT